MTSISPSLNQDYLKYQSFFSNVLSALDFKKNHFNHKSYNTFIEKINMFDSIRKEKTFEIIPELKVFENISKIELK